MLDGRARGELGDRVRVAEHVRRLQVDEVRDREQRGVELLAAQRDRERGLGVDHRVPRHDRVEAGEKLGRLGVDEVAERGVELAAAPLPHERPHGLDAADAVRDLDELAELREPRCERDRLAAELPGQPLPSHISYAAPSASSTSSDSSSCSPSARAIAAWWSIMLSTSRWPESTKLSPIRKRWSGGLPAPIRRSPETMHPLAAQVVSPYLSAFSAMSSPNHFACSCASVWQPTLTSSAV